MKRSGSIEAVAMVPHVARWLALSTVLGLFSGTASALFLVALDWATDTRLAHPWLVWLLPVAGFATGWVYYRIGQPVEGGNNLLIDEIHDPKTVVPKRMGPLILVATVITHLFGGSAGREGTAVQMGGALADRITHALKLGREDRRVMLMAGIAAGFSSVFGTPLAGTIFGLEVLAIGKLRYDALLACLISAVVADEVTRLWGVHHTVYTIPFVPALSVSGFASAVAAGIVFGFTVVTLASGFKGGEVTPLFYIGATLGNALGYVLSLPFPVLAGLGFVAVFAGAANTPVASTIMAIELFGGSIGVYAAIACTLAYLFSGHTGIYRAQRVGHPKHWLFPEGVRLADIPAWRRAQREKARHEQD